MRPVVVKKALDKEIPEVPEETDEINEGSSQLGTALQPATDTSISRKKEDLKKDISYANFVKQSYEKEGNRKLKRAQFPSQRKTIPFHNKEIKNSDVKGYIKPKVDLLPRGTFTPPYAIDRQEEEKRVAQKEPEKSIEEETYDQKSDQVKKDEEQKESTIKLWEEVCLDFEDVFEKLPNKKLRNFHIHQLLRIIRRINADKDFYPHRGVPIKLIQEEFEKWLSENYSELNEHLNLFDQPNEFRIGAFLLHYIADFYANEIVVKFHKVPAFSPYLINDTTEETFFNLIQSLESSDQVKKEILTNEKRLKVILLKWLIHLPPKIREQSETDLLIMFLERLKSTSLNSPNDWHRLINRKDPIVWSRTVSCCRRITCETITNYLCCCFSSSTKAKTNNPTTITIQCR